MRKAPIVARFVLRLVPLAVGGCDSCFVAGTRVATPSGPRPIETLRPDDEIFSHSIEPGARVVRSVRAILRSKQREIRRIVAGSRVISGVTPSHPFYDPERASYRTVRDLAVGDSLASLEGEELRRCTIDSIVATESAAPSIDVFNLTIDGPEANYFAEGLLVHNKEMDPMCPNGTVTISEGFPEPEADASPGAIATTREYDIVFSVVPQDIPSISSGCIVGSGQGGLLPLTSSVAQLSATRWRVRIENPELLSPRPPGRVECLVGVDTWMKIDGKDCRVFENVSFSVPIAPEPDI